MSLTYPLKSVPMLGKGSVLLDRLDSSGNGTGLIHIGNATKFNIDLKDDKAELYSSLNKTVSLLATALKKRQPMVTIEGTDFSSEKMALAMMSAGKSTLTVTAASITAEQLVGTAPTKKGKYFLTAKMNVDPLATNIVVKQGVTTLTAVTDYVLMDAATGLFYFPVGSTVDDTAAVTVDYHTLATTFDQVAQATIPFLQARLHFNPDPVDGQKIRVDIWKTNLSPNGQWGFIADDYGNWTLEGYILDDSANHPASPFGIMTFLP